MFTGLVSHLAQVLRVEAHAGGLSIFLNLNFDLANSASLKVGDSVAVDGACLTVVSLEKISDKVLVAKFDVSPETLQKTHFGTTKARDFVHVEMSLRMGDSMGGHYVSGHVDGVGTIQSIKNEGEYLNAIIEIKNPLAFELRNYFVTKGSIGVDGVSLTINSVNQVSNSNGLQSLEVGLMLIPETIRKTKWSFYKVGDQVHLEGDLFAKHISKYMDDYLKRFPTLRATASEGITV